MKNKFLTAVFMLVFCVLMIVSVNATTKTTITKDSPLIDMNAFDEVYKLSEQGEKISLPFINVFSSGAIYDELVKHSGISIGSSTIDINEKLEGVQIIVSNDMVSIKGEVEHAIIYGNNVVIEGNVSGDSLILSPSVKILENAKVSRDVIIIANELEIAGTVEGNVIAAVSNSVKISGKIGKDFRAITGIIDVEGSDIKGNIYIKTNADTTKLLEKYESVTVVSINNNEDSNKSSKILDIVIKGIITVVVYSAICFFITRKEGNIVSKATAKFKEHTIYGVIAACIYFLLLIILPIVLILLVTIDLGIIALPVLIIYLAILLLSLSTSTLVVGMTIYESLRYKVEKYKLPVIAGIFAVLYILSNIPYIAYYVLTAINLVSLAVIITMITKKNKKKEEKINNNK